MKYEAISEIEKSSFLLVSTSLLHQVAIVIFPLIFIPATVTTKGNARGCSSGKKSFSLFSIITFMQVGMVEKNHSALFMHNKVLSVTERRFERIYG